MRSEGRGRGGHLGKEQSLWHQAEGQLVTGIVQEVLQPQEGHAAQLPPVPPVDPDLQLPGLHGEARLSGGEPGTSHYLSSLPPHEPRSPRSTQGQPHPLQGNDKGLVPGLLGHRPPARLAHNAIVHLQHGQHLTCKARVGAQGRPGVGGGNLCAPQLPGPPTHWPARLPHAAAWLCSEASPGKGSRPARPRGNVQALPSAAAHSPGGGPAVSLSGSV